MTREKAESKAEVRARSAPKSDAAGQYAASQASPNPGGVVSANPTILSGDGDATSGQGHGRDRDGSKRPNKKSSNDRGQTIDDWNVSGLPSSAAKK